MKKFFLFALMITGFIITGNNSFAANEPFRSNGSGNWNDISIWQYSTNGGATFVGAPTAPNVSSGVITIRNGHTINANINASADQVVISNGGQLAINSGITFTIVNGTSEDLKLETGSILNGPGTLSTKGNTVDLIIANGASFNGPLSVDSGFTVAGDAASPFTAKFNGSITINSGASFAPTNGMMIQANGNVINNGSIFQTTNSTFIMRGPSFVNNGSVNILTFRFDSTTSISGSSAFSPLTLVIGNSGNVALTGDFTFSPPSSFTLNSGGILNPDSNILTINTSAQYIFNSNSTISNPGTVKTQGTPFIVVENNAHFNADLKVNSGTTTVSQSASPFIPEFNGTITIDNGATLTNAGGRSPQANGNVINNGTISPFNSHFRFNGSSFVNNNSVTSDVRFLSGNHLLSGTGFTNSNLIILSGSNVTMTSNHKLNHIDINTGGVFDITGKTLSLTSSNPITNNGVFEMTNSTIEYAGTATQNISYANITYTNLKINNPANVAMIGNFSVNDTLSMLNGDLYLFGYTITLSPTGFLTETSGNTVQSGCCGGIIKTTRVINAPTALNVGGLGAAITTVQNLDTVEIRRGHIEHFGINGVSSIFRYFDITPKNNTGLNATLVFKYDDSELNNLNEGSLSLFRSTNGGSTFTFRGGTVNTTANTVTLSGIDAFSRWTLGRGAINNQLKILIEGFYNVGLNKINMRDTVRAYLRSSTSPFAIIDSAKSVIDSNTFTGNYLFLNAASGTYYIQLKHRNGLETWSRSGGESYTIGTALNYDFTTDSSKAFGDNLKKQGSKWTVFGGDVVHDGTVDVGDMLAIYNSANNLESGYITTDVNGDNFADVTDLLLAYNNSNAVVSVISP